MQKLKAYKSENGDIFVLKENEEFSFIVRYAYDGAKIIETSRDKGMTIEEFNKYFTRSFARRK